MAERKKRATLCCSVCGARNYTFAKGKATERAERMKLLPAVQAAHASPRIKVI